MLYGVSAFHIMDRGAETPHQHHRRHRALKHAIQLRGRHDFMHLTGWLSDCSALETPGWRMIIFFNE